ncbi:hypothetical protein F5Y16DRAFT_399129 [Xylariaceae sp. FL0255]|nr:hypothetical protein F5Y16DRAFT_399129 [Xylariaceae sp. FL0255]
MPAVPKKDRQDAMGPRLMAYLANLSSHCEGQVMDMLLDKFLSVLGLEPPQGEGTQRYHLHRDISIHYAPWRPMPGNDFNYPVARITSDPLSWSAHVQMATPTKARAHAFFDFPFAHSAQLADQKMIRKIKDKFVPVLRQLWPSTTTTTPRRSLLGPRFKSTRLPEYSIMNTLGSLNMNMESVAFQSFSDEIYYFKSSTESVRTLLSINSPSNLVEPYLDPCSINEVGGFTVQCAHLWQAVKNPVDFDSC